jgi:hypothetical protein
MIKIRRWTECQRCQLFSGFLGDEFPVCGIFPLGPSQIPCPDFAEVTEDCVPVGGAYYNGKLILDSAGYLTTAERLELIETHPLFTGICPKCKKAIAGSNRIHWDCPNQKCDWIDNSVV